MVQIVGGTAMQVMQRARELVDAHGLQGRPIFVIECMVYAACPDWSGPLACLTYQSGDPLWTPQP